MLAFSNIAAKSEEKLVALPLKNETFGLPMRCSFTQIVPRQHSKLYVRFLETYLSSGYTVVLFWFLSWYSQIILKGSIAAQVILTAN